jgi:hypothetical protein
VVTEETQTDKALLEVQVVAVVRVALVQQAKEILEAQIMAVVVAQMLLVLLAVAVRANPVELAVLVQLPQYQVLR